MTSRQMDGQQWSMLVLLAFIWGASFVFIEMALEAFPPLFIVALRVVIAACVLWMIVRLRNIIIPRDPKIWQAFFIMGFLNNVIPFSLIIWGQSYISGGLASTLNAATPLFTVAIAHFATQDEKMTGARFTGMVLGITGVALMIGLGALAGLGTHILAQVAILGAALSYAISGIYGHRFSKAKVPPLMTATEQLTAASILTLPASVIIDQPWALPAPSTEALVAVLALSLVSTAFAYILYFRLLATAGATNLLLVTFLVPVSAVCLGIVLLGEQLQIQHFAGMALISLGLAAIDGRPLRALKKRFVRSTRLSERHERTEHDQKAPQSHDNL